MMKKLQWLPLFTLLMLILAGCASSERMMRMSGGVFDSYSAPSEQRIRSKKYRAIEMNSSDSRYSRNQAGKDGRILTLNENLVNLWPFYFRSGEYTSVLWPLIDSDPYGFAFRPFYNHEGDDYSILFPLSSWNTESKSGWCLISYWDKHKFMLLPFLIVSDNYSLLLPLGYYSAKVENGQKIGGTAVFLPAYIGHWNHKVETGYEKYRTHYNQDSAFNMILLGYYGKDVFKNLQEFDQMFRQRTTTDKQRRDYLTRLFGNSAVKLPQTKAEIEDLRRRVFDSVPPDEVTTYGFFPLFLRKSGPRSNWTALFAALYLDTNDDAIKKYTRSLGWGILYDYKAEKELSAFPESGKIRNRTRHRILWNILAGWENVERYTRDNAELNHLTEIMNLSNNWGYEQNLAKIMRIWKEIDPKLQIPESVTDADSMYRFAINYASERTYPTVREHSFKSIYYTGSTDGTKKSGSIPMLLSWWDYDTESGTSGFNSIPLLTFISHAPEKNSENILGGLVWHSNDMHYDRKDKTVYSRDTYFADGSQQLVYEKNGLCFLGLYYRGDNAFLVAKEGYDANTLNKLRQSLRELSGDWNHCRSERQGCKDALEGIEKRKTNTKVERLEKELDLARLEEREEKLEKQIEKLQDKVQKVRGQMQSIGYELKLPKLEEEDFDPSEIIAELAEKCTEERHYRDAGGPFWNCETSESGARKWKVFFNLIAGGNRIGESEHEHVLHFLYRYTREGNRSEKLIFPFWSEQKDGENSTKSFMWRLWRKTKKDGKTGGYFFFIPYGDVH